MAAIELRLALISVLAATLISADQAQDALGAVNRMTTALADNDAGAAMDAFDKSFPQYDTLAAYFGNLTASYLITNEAGIVDEQGEPNKTVLTFDWTLTLHSQSTDETFRRSRQVTVTVVKKSRDWKIVAFSPIALFNPQQ